jgi:PAS domain S-box-containing protein
LKSRVNKIYKLILELSRGNYHCRGVISDSKDEYDAIITGINMLAEELQDTTISRDYLKSIYDGIVDMVIVTDSKGLIEDTNSTTNKYLGHHDLMGKSFNIIFPPSQQISLSELISDLNINNTLHNIERTLMIEGCNSPIAVSCSFSMIRKKHDDIFKILMVIKDVSHLKKTEQMLVKRNQELNTFVYRASHDLKGPLASMLGLMSLIQIDEDDIESTKDYFQLIKESTEKLNKVVTDLLDLGKITISEIQREEIFVRNILDSILDDMKFLHDRDQLSITINDNQVTPFISEPKIIKSILHNLLENSLKYRKANKKSNVNIAINNFPSGLEIILEDDGIGIDKNVQDKVFDMFFRGTAESNGSGLGLYIVKTGIEKLQGKIELYSKLSMGSRFVVTLPNTDDSLAS